MRDGLRRKTRQNHKLQLIDVAEFIIGPAEGRTRWHPSCALAQTGNQKFN
jgi:hypothetical protein